MLIYLFVATFLQMLKLALKDFYKVLNLVNYSSWVGNAQNSVGKTETQLRAVLAQWLLKPWETASAPWTWVMDGMPI